MVGGKDEETHSKGEDHDQDDAGHEWSFEENKTFENAIAQWMSKDSGSSEDLMVMMIQQMASKIPGKTVRQIRHHLKALSEDIEMIERGLIPIPNYVDHNHIDTKPTSNTVPRRRGIPWTQQEHELFLEGLVKYGKGDWRSISRLCVVTRTPTQVASHAQKHFLRCENRNKKMAKKYSSSPSPSPAGHHHHHHHVSQGQCHATLITAASSSPPPPPPCPSCQRPFSF